MANELLIGVKIGASLSGAFNTAFASVRGTMGKLGQVSDELRTKHNRLGEVMARAMAHPTRNVGELRRHYERLGQTLDQLRIKQEKLAASMARGEALRNARADMRGEAMEAAGTAVAMGAPVISSVRNAANFQDQMRDTAITGEFSKAEEANLSRAVRESALKWNQTQSEVARGTSVLVAGGIQNAKSLEAYAPVMAKAATATRASMDDLGSVAIALKDNLRIGESGFEGALNMLAYAGKRGQFEIRDMARWLPSLSPSFQAMGVTGKEAVAEIGAALQIARKGAGTNDEAANNFRNFLTKITAPDTLKDFEKAGIDLKTSMTNLRAQGMTPVQSMLEVITQYMQSKGPEAAGQFQKVMAIKDDKEREAAMQRLSEAYKLGELFQDMQAMSFIRPAIANAAEMKSIKQGSLEASNKDLLGDDFKKRMDTATEQFKAFRIGISDLGITVGNALLPPLISTLNAINPVITALNQWAMANPAIVSGVIGLVGGLIAGKLAFIGIRYGINLLQSPFSSVNLLMDGFSAKLTVLKAMQQAGSFAPFLRNLQQVRGGLTSAVGRVSGMGLTGIGQSLASGFQMALPWVGRIGMTLLRLTPIGLALSAVGLLVYKYWQPIKGFFVGLWQGLSSVAGSAIKGLMQSIAGFGMTIGRLMLSIPGIGFAFRLIGAVARPVFSAIGAGVRGVWNWFRNLLKPVDDVGGKAQNMGVRVGLALGGIIKGIANLPARFLRLGSEIVNGLVSGIKARLGEAVKAVGGLGDAIAGKFKSALGIKSPSRVFMGFGDNIAQGAAIGIGRTAGMVAKATVGMALATTAAWGQPALTAPVAGKLPAMARPATTPEREQLAERLTRTAPPTMSTPAATAMHIVFSPQITLQPGTPKEVQQQVSQAMQMSFAEFERMMKRYEADKKRRSYGGNS